MKVFIWVLFVQLVLLYTACDYIEYDSEPKSGLISAYYCDADSVVVKDGITKFFDQSAIFGNGETQSSDFSKSGNYSIKLDAQQQFGGSIELTKFQGGNYIQVEVYRYKGDENSKLVVATPNGTVYQSTGTPVSMDEDGWGLMRLDIELPEQIMNEKKISIYCWNSGNQVAYFDDLKIKVHSEKVYPEFNVPNLEIKIKKKHLKKLKKIRKEALEAGVLLEKKWVKAKMKFGEEKFKVKVRLKGDWTDHLIGRKWSLRVKIDEEKTWRGMKEFSIQTPESRSFLDEWVYHKMCEQEDVLAPRYGFIPVRLNNRSLGIYAYEEHFTKHLVENQNRREGPIIKFDETGLWEDMRLLKKLKKPNYHMRPYYNSSLIEPFKEKKTLKKESLYNNFLVGQNLVQAYKEGLTAVDPYFDLRKLAYYYAITDFLMAKHAFKWHNQRFYYNPVNAKLEMIAYDGYGGYREESDSNAITFAHRRDCDFKLFFEDDIPTYYPLNDKAFLEEYKKALKKISE
ncbi:MAG: CotH kinase family protein, partial [Flavobacteriales bacterium]|nr:CotH kinase family protein [Flavobacteriales bacterium]